MTNAFSHPCFQVALLALALTISPVAIADPSTTSTPTVRVDTGVLSGVRNATTGVDEFKGIPYAAPPVGPLRWNYHSPRRPHGKARKADRFGPRCMQLPLYGDMVFRSDGMSEDCLDLNVWTPAGSENQ